ncbi:MAG: 23S rRNA pseudouridine(1911/1915/1917) synthase RluD [Gammaproteobacteria bacterium]|nr:23S rRNA pseudouridine(1911/1915/1917) synthase RluD [Gammaproteobacteria bacterium]
MPEIQTTISIPDELTGQRLDVVLAELVPDYSRNRLKQWLLEGQILLDGQTAKPKTKVYGDQQLQLNIKAVDVDDVCVAEDIPLNIVYQDDSLIVVNKPAGLVVHPAAGHRQGTLQNALLFFDKTLADVPRAGIVHRLDKDTSGLMVVARTLASHKYLVNQIQQRDVHREYQTLVHGVMTGGGTVDQPIGRHAHDRIRMTVREDGRPSVTHYRVLDRYRVYTHLHVELETGRTHQIRVHMQHLRHPVVGDPVYAGRSRLPAGADESFLEQLKNFKRQALHAWRLSLNHPETGELIQWEAPLPEDMVNLIAGMKEDMEKHG